MNLTTQIAFRASWVHKKLKVIIGETPMHSATPCNIQSNKFTYVASIM